jgi:hypothetical protein
MELRWTLSLVLATSGCLSPSHTLLNADVDGGHGDAGALADASDGGPTEPLWTDCTAAAHDARHMDACGGSWEGGVCNGAAGRVATCLDGRTLVSEDVPVDRADVDHCEGSFAWSAYLVDVVSVEAGCAEVHVCHVEMRHRRRWHSCQLDPLPAVRDDAPVEAWSDCEAALQAGTDGDRCQGDFTCMGQRRLGATTSSNLLVVGCDDGILRMLVGLVPVYRGID